MAADAILPDLWDMIATYGDFVVAFVAVLASLSLVLVTVRYARSTEAIAVETRNAASSARAAAEVSLLHGLLEVQPRIAIRDVARVDSHLQDLPPVPIKIQWRVNNFGKGIGYDVSALVTIDAIELELSEVKVTNDGISFSSIGTRFPEILDPGQAIMLAHVVNSNARQKLLVRFAEQAEPIRLRLLLQCQDAFGGKITHIAEYELNRGNVAACSVCRTYNGGPELIDRLRELQSIVLPS